MFLKLACVACALYIGMTLILQLVPFLLVRTQCIVGIRMSGLRFGILFGVIWFVSFALPWRIFLSSFRSKLPFSLS
jgi:hypothetical protein